ncbi:head-tail connector protein [Novispirillum sp. DQ9]|uniref:head-tail connector protein n=1 Tax=Novispirillum sp. DQ9 TaxID=3398612 RepID=UPI003C7C9F78
MLTTLATVKADLGIAGDDASLDAFLTRAIEAASGRIEGHCGRTFGVRAASETFRLERCKPRLLLSHWPVTAVEGVTVDGITVPEAERSVEDGIFLRRLDADGDDSLWPAGKVVVAYTAGYVLPGDDGANLPAAVEQACIDLVRIRYHGRDRDPALRSESVDGVYTASYRDAVSVDAIPDGVADALAPYVRVHIA